MTGWQTTTRSTHRAPPITFCFRESQNSKYLKLPDQSGAVTGGGGGEVRHIVAVPTTLSGVFHRYRH